MASPRDTHGPIVKSGPTKGKNRSRSNSGAWRKKRNDTGKSRKSGGFCFLTTAVCQHKGLPDDCAELETLRTFRDSYLMTTLEGSRLVEEYYGIAPKISLNISDENVYEYIWSAVQECIQFINANMPENAVLRYKEMVYALREK